MAATLTESRPPLKRMPVFPEREASPNGQREDVVELIDLVFGHPVLACECEWAPVANQLAVRARDPQVVAGRDAAHRPKERFLDIEPAEQDPLSECRKVELIPHVGLCGKGFGRLRDEDIAVAPIRPEQWHGPHVVAHHQDLVASGIEHDDRIGAAERPERRTSMAEKLGQDPLGRLRLHFRRGRRFVEDAVEQHRDIAVRGECHDVADPADAR